jgi:hypothetical protein
MANIDDPIDTENLTWRERRQLAKARGKTILESHEDWDMWFAQFESTAKGLGFWEYVNPQGARIDMKIPTRPVFPMSMDPGSFYANDITLTLRIYELELRTYEVDLDLRQRHQDRFFKFLRAMHDTLGDDYWFYLTDVDFIRADIRKLERNRGRAYSTRY